MEVTSLTLAALPAQLNRPFSCSPLAEEKVPMLSLPVRHTLATLCDAPSTVGGPGMCHVQVGTWLLKDASGKIKRSSHRQEVDMLGNDKHTHLISDSVFPWPWWRPWTYCNPSGIF